MEQATQVFEQHRRFLKGLAYRMLGSVAEAEDIVQDCWLRWRNVRHEDIAQPKAYLAQTTTRLCLDRLGSAALQREQYIGVWLPEPWVEHPEFHEPAAEDLVATAQSLEMAFLLVLQQLSAAERAVFLLNEVFDWDFNAIAQMLDRSPAACRQLAVRARQRMAQAKQADQPNPRHGRGRQPIQSPRRATSLAQAFATALQTGDTQTLANTLAYDVVFMADGGGKANAVPRPVVGADKVAKMLVGFAALWAREPGTVHFAWINNMPGAVFRHADGQVIQTLSMAVNAEEKISAIYVTRNPDKLQAVPTFD